MKNKKITIGIAATLGGLAAVQGCDGQLSQPIADNINIVSAKLEQLLNGENSDSIDLEKQLKELSKTKYAADPLWGAMCYDIAEPEPVDYVCSYCGDTIKKYDSWTLYDIESIEEIVGEIKSLGYDAVLDKTEYCPHCSKKEINEPELIFKIRFSEKAKYHIVKSNIIDNYECLQTFLLNPDTYLDNYYEKDLPEIIATIQYMTGLGKDLKIK